MEGGGIMETRSVGFVLGTKLFIIDLNGYSFIVASFFKK